MKWILLLTLASALAACGGSPSTGTVAQYPGCTVVFDSNRNHVIAGRATTRFNVAFTAGPGWIMGTDDQSHYANLQTTDGQSWTLGDCGV